MLITVDVCWAPGKGPCVVVALVFGVDAAGVDGGGVSAGVPISVSWLLPAGMIKPRLLEAQGLVSRCHQCCKRPTDRLLGYFGRRLSIPYKIVGQSTFGWPPFISSRRSRRSLRMLSIIKTFLEEWLYLQKHRFLKVRIRVCIACLPDYSHSEYIPASV